MTLWTYVAQYDQAKLVVVNCSSHQARGWLKLLLSSKAPTVACLCDELTGTAHIVDSKTVSTRAIHLDLSPWNARVFDMNCGLPASSPL